MYPYFIIIKLLIEAIVIKKNWLLLFNHKIVKIKYLHSLLFDTKKIKLVGFLTIIVDYDICKIAYPSQYTIYSHIQVNTIILEF